MSIYGSLHSYIQICFDNEIKTKTKQLSEYFLNLEVKFIDKRIRLLQYRIT